MFLMRSISVISAVLLCLVCASVDADDRWVWHNKNRQERVLNDNPQYSNGIRNGHDKYRRELYLRDREPTTRRPIPGVIQSDDIEDYPDVGSTSAPTVGTRQYPYAPGGFGGYGGNNPGFGGNGGAFSFGPVGPPGIVGQPQQPYPLGTGAGGNYQPGFGSGYPGGAQNGFGYQGAYPTAGYGGNYPTQGFYPGSQSQYGQYPGAQSHLSPYPGAQANYGQYPGAQSQHGQYPGAQFPVGTQYPAAAGYGSQFGQFGPSVGQYPGAGGAQYPEGFGSAYGSQPGAYGNGFGTTGFPSIFGFDEKNNNRIGPDGKSAKIEARTNSKSQKVDDKLSKASKNS